MSDAPKAKPAAKTEGKPAAEKAAAKAPAKAAAKGAAKGAVAKAAKPVVEKRTEGPRKKSKTPLVPRPANPQALINKKLWEARAAHNKAAGAKRVTEQKKKAERRKAIREAKKKGLPKPKLPKVKKSIRNKERKAKLAAQKGKTVADPKVAHQRFFLQLTPLNKWFQDRFGFIFSEFIGKAREKALRARNVRVVVHQPGLALNGRVGKLIYYTGKHRGFVKIGHTVFKIPFHFLFRRKVYHTEIRKRLFVSRQNRRRADHASKLRAHQKGAEAAKAGGKAAAPAAAAAFKEVAYKELPPRGKRAPKKERKNKTKPAPKTKKAEGLDALPAKPFPNVGNAVKNNKGLLVHKAIQKKKKASEDAKKAGKKSEKKVDKKARNARRRRGQKGKPRPKTAAAAAAPAGNAAATKAPAAKPAAKPAAAARKA